MIWLVYLSAVAGFLIFLRCCRYENALINISHSHGKSARELQDIADKARGK